jgi:sugar lactone lactonase YvrE
MAPGIEGQPFYVTNEAELRTWAFDVEPDGTLSDPRLFVEAGGEGLTVDEKGNVYIAAGQILVFNPAGRQIDTIEVPQRPTCLVFGGSDRRTLFITARSSLYSVRTRTRGRTR